VTRPKANRGALDGGVADRRRTPAGPPANGATVSRHRCSALQERNSAGPSAAPAGVRLVVGLHGGADAEYVRTLVDAGADEFFLGYVPEAWWKRVGFEFSPNRRYQAGSQVTSLRQLHEICGAASQAGRPVAVTFNEHFVTRWAWAAGTQLIYEAVEAGVSAVIVADLSVVAPLRKEFPDVAIHVSGDSGLYNAAGADLAFSAGAGRVIFPRELPLPDMAETISLTGAGEFEAFVMGEPCVFDGARCFTEHGYGFKCDFCNAHVVKMLTHRAGGAPRPLAPSHKRLLDEAHAAEVRSLGRCGLCAIPELRGMGVTHLKIPGRASDALKNTKLVRALLDVPEAAAADARALLAAPDVCASGTFCYYPRSTRQ